VGTLNRDSLAIWHTALVAPHPGAMAWALAAIAPAPGPFHPGG